VTKPCPSSVLYVRSDERIVLDDPMAGIALSGGGSYGAFAAGIVHQAFSTFLEEGKLPRLRIISGTSTGALVAGLLTQLYGRFKKGDAPEKALDDLQRAYTETEQDEVGRKPKSLPCVVWNLMMHDGVMDIRPLRDLIERSYEEAYMTAALAEPSPIIYSCNFIDMPSGQQRHFASDDAGGAAAARMVPAIFASCAQPVVMTPAFVDGYWATDGGVREVIPFREVMHRGCTAVMAVALNEPEIDHVEEGMAEGDDHNPLEMIERGLMVMNDEVARDDERLARVCAYLRRAKDILAHEGVAPSVLEAAFPPGPLEEDIDPAPGDQDPYDNAHYNHSELRDILLFRFGRQKLPPQDVFTPETLAPMFADGAKAAEENMSAIRELLFVGGSIEG